MKSIEFTTATIEKAVEAIKNHNSEFSAIRREGENLTVEEVAQRMIIERFGDAQIEAEEIVNDLKRGIAAFDEQFLVNQESEMIVVRDILSQATNGKSEDEKRNCYVNILTAIELLNDSELTQEKIDAKLEENAQLSEEILLSRIELELNDKVNLTAILDQVTEGLTNESLSKVFEILEGNRDEQRLISALWLYIEQREGHIRFSDSEFDMPTDQIGALAAASTEMMIATNNLKEGKIDQKTWQKIIKWIVGALIGISLGVLALSLIVNVSLLTVAAIWSVFGAGVFATILALIAAFCTAWFTADWAVNLCVKAVDKFIDFYDNNISKFSSKFHLMANTVREWAKQLREKVKLLFSKNGNEGDQGSPGNGGEENASILQIVIA